MTKETLIENLSKCTKLYYGKDHWCRCGCGGNYFYYGCKVWKQMVTKCLKAFEAGKVIEIDNSGSYLNLSMDRNKAYCLYFD